MFNNLWFSLKDGGRNAQVQSLFALGSLHQHLCWKHLNMTNGFPEEMEECSDVSTQGAVSKKMDEPKHQWKVMIPGTPTKRLFLCFYNFPSPILLLPQQYYRQSSLELKATHEIIWS